MALSKKELAAIETAHRMAQARLGVSGAFLATRAWEGVSPTSPMQTGDSWVTRSLRMINAIRRKSYRLAQAYVRVTRALEIGYTLGLYPEESDNPKDVTLGSLRKEYLDILNEVATIDSSPSSTTNVDEKWFESELRAAVREKPRPNEIVMADTDIDAYIQHMLDVSTGNDNDSILVDAFEWTPETTPEDIDKAFRDELQNLLQTQETKADKIRKADVAAPPKETFKAVEQAHEKTGVLAAGQVDLFSIAEGREVLDDVIVRDRKVKVVTRGTRPGCCAFCAMLASRGWVFRDEFVAEFTKNRFSRKGNDMSPQMKDGIRKYHPNCKCYPIVHWIDVPELLPNRNVYFKEMWKKEVADKGFQSLNGSMDALNAFRRWLNRARKQGLIPADEQDFNTN